MKKYTKVIASAIIILLLGFGLLLVRARYFSAPDQGKKAVQEISTTLTINGSSSQSFDISDFIGKSVLEATESKAKIVASGTGKNAFITSINGRAADTKKREFWELDANGKETEVGAGSYIIQKGDTILWHINTY